MPEGNAELSPTIQESAGTRDTQALGRNKAHSVPAPGALRILREEQEATPDPAHSQRRPQEHLREGSYVGVQGPFAPGCWPVCPVAPTRGPRSGAVELDPGPRKDLPRHLGKGLGLTGAYSAWPKQMHDGLRQRTRCKTEPRKAFSEEFNQTDF